jgi:hypothetical protein
VLVTIRQWGDEWILGAGHGPVTMVHTTCGSRTTAILSCDHCGEQLHGSDLRVVARPELDREALVALHPTSGR